MEDEIQYQSKTQRKKEAEELQRLGLKLDNLSVQQLENIEIPKNLKTALIEGKSITSHIAGRRHRQFIGALMRNIDPESIRLALLQAEEKNLLESEAAKESKVWIDKLLTGEPAEMEALLDEFPGLERQRLRQLVRNIKKGAPGTKSLKFRETLEKLIKVEINSK
ncbi:ribosome biogenesis factor YjgA [Desulfobacula sp.]|uniref:ribosome biogenesis factor YjgA n=1 Tax=Desulfobacula sp. TaxID=2593537 RepID=UPI00261348DD|nr:ribosome biogenesis factor YjgA [Desulfobacula sp.]